MKVDTIKQNEDGTYTLTMTAKPEEQAALVQFAMNYLMSVGLVAAQQDIEDNQLELWDADGEPVN